MPEGYPDEEAPTHSRIPDEHEREFSSEIYVPVRDRRDRAWLGSRGRLVLSCPVALATIWVPICFMGELKHFLRIVCAQVALILSLLALLPLLLAASLHNLHELREEFHRVVEKSKVELKSGVKDSMFEGTKHLPTALEDMERRLLAHLEAVPEQLREAVASELSAMRHAAEAEGAQLARVATAKLQNLGDQSSKRSRSSRSSGSASR